MIKDLISEAENWWYFFMINILGRGKLLLGKRLIFLGRAVDQYIIKQPTPTTSCYFKFQIYRILVSKLLDKRKISNFHPPSTWIRINSATSYSENPSSSLLFFILVITPNVSERCDIKKLRDLECKRGRWTSISTEEDARKIFPSSGNFVQQLFIQQ